MAGRLVTASAMTETQLKDTIRKLCGEMEIPVEHVENSARGRTWLKGMPDLTIFGQGEICYRELKNEYESLSADQRSVRDVIRAAGGDWALWRPRHWFNGTILYCLTWISPLEDITFTARDIERLTPRVAS